MSSSISSSNSNNTSSDINIEDHLDLPSPDSKPLDPKVAFLNPELKMLLADQKTACPRVLKDQ